MLCIWESMVIRVQENLRIIPEINLLLISILANPRIFNHDNIALACFHVVRLVAPKRNLNLHPRLIEHLDIAPLLLIIVLQRYNTRFSVPSHDTNNIDEFVLLQTLNLVDSLPIHLHKRDSPVVNSSKNRRLLRHCHHDFTFITNILFNTPQQQKFMRYCRLTVS